MLGLPFVFRSPGDWLHITIELNRSIYEPTTLLQVLTCTAKAHAIIRPRPIPVLAFVGLGLFTGSWHICVCGWIFRKRQSLSTGILCTAGTDLDCSDESVIKIVDSRYKLGQIGAIDGRRSVTRRADDISQSRRFVVRVSQTTVIFFGSAKS